MSSAPATLAVGKYLHLMKRDGWEYVERRGVTGIVGIVATTDDGKLLLVEQYRPPLQVRVVELPAGLVGDTPGAPDESLLVAAGRELSEETGYEAGTLSLLPSGPVSAGMSTEVITLVRATSLRRVSAGGGVEGENITLHEIPLADVPQRLKQFEADGLLIDLKVYAGLYFAANS